MNAIFVLLDGLGSVMPPIGFKSVAKKGIPMFSGARQEK